MTNNKTVLDWIEKMVQLVKPDKVVWIDGSEEQLEALRAEACASGEMIKLNEEKLPGCYLHRTAVNDVARVEHRTFICCDKEEDAGILAYAAAGSPQGRKTSWGEAERRSVGGVPIP